MNPFADISDSATLLALVQDGVECERCKGRGIVIMPVKIFAHKSDPPGLADLRWPRESCPTCNGTGHTPLSNPDLDALAACWCEGLPKVELLRMEEPDEVSTADVAWFYRGENGYSKRVPCYTTSPDAAMRLQVKYNVEPVHLGKIWCAHVWVKHQLITIRSGYTQDSEKVEALCHAITEAALVAALTEAMEGVSK